jgi:hypothetical protein
VRDTPDARLRLARTVAHELAHVWQANVRQGGIGEGPAWVYEGGAEALAVAALRDTGIASPAQAGAIDVQLQEECARLKGGVDTYRGFYACGYTRHARTGAHPVLLWKRMIEASERSGETYSPAMFDAAAAALRK